MLGRDKRYSLFVQRIIDEEKGFGRLSHVVNVLKTISLFADAWDE